MILLNFAAKFHDIQFRQFSALTSQTITEQIMLNSALSADEDISQVLDKAFIKVKLTDDELTSQRIVLNLPQQPVVSLKIIHYLKQKCGIYPMVIRTNISVFTMKAGPEVVEVLDLQELF